MRKETVFSVSLLLLLPCCATQIQQPKHIVKVEIASIPYRTRTVLAVQPAKVYTWEEMIRSEITRRDDLDFFEDRLRAAVAIPHKDCIDARLVCVIRWTDRSIDTMVFGEMFQAYNRQCYKMDSLLIRRIASNIPDERHRSEIDYYVQEIYPMIRWSHERER